jgi:hypothetical protein
VALATREHSLLAVAAVALGLAAVWQVRRMRSMAWFVTVALAGNMFLAALVAGPRRVRGFDTSVHRGGYLAGEYLALALLAALGASALLSLARRRVAETGGDRQWIPFLAPALLVALALPPLVAHAKPVLERRAPTFAADYGRNLLGQLDEGAVLIVRGPEIAFPLRYRQIVEGDRDEVDIVVADLLRRAWYHRQVEDRLGLTFAARDDEVSVVTNLIDAIGDDRPVYVDLAGVAEYRRTLGLRTEGLVARVVEGTGFQPVDFRRLERTISSYHLDGVYDDAYRLVWPNDTIVARYGTMHDLAGGEYLEADQPDDATRHFEAALAIDPSDEFAQEGLREVARRADGS